MPLRPYPKPEKNKKEKTKKIKPRSSKRASQEAKYNKRVKAWILDKICAMCEDMEYDTPATECHHMQGREGDLLLDESKWLPLCHIHHRQITDDSSGGIAQGYSLPRNC